MERKKAEEPGYQADFSSWFGNSQFHTLDLFHWNNMGFNPPLTDL